MNTLGDDKGGAVEEKKMVYVTPEIVDFKWMTCLGQGCHSTGSGNAADCYQAGNQAGNVCYDNGKTPGKHCNDGNGYV